MFSDHTRLDDPSSGRTRVFPCAAIRMTYNICFTRTKIRDYGRDLLEPTLADLHGEVRQEISNLVVFAPVPEDRVSDARGRCPSSRDEIEDRACDTFIYGKQTICTERHVTTYNVCHRLAVDHESNAITRAPKVDLRGLFAMSRRAIVKARK